MVDKETIETKVVDSKEKVETTLDDKKEKIKTKAKEEHAKNEERKEKVMDKTKDTIDFTKNKTIETLGATKDKTKETIDFTKDKTKETIDFTKDKTKETIDFTKNKAEETKEKSKQIKDNVEQDITEGVDFFRDQVKSIQKIIDEKINDYAEGNVKNLDTEILESEEKYYVRVAVPGISKENIDISATEREIIIEATFKPLSESYEDANVLLNEMKVGKCSKNINFNSEIDIDNIKAKYELGIVDIVLPKAETPSQKITIE